MSEWISVEDELPKSIGCFLGFGNGLVYFLFYSSELKWCMGNDYIEGVTHWMPLPKPPES